jgi:serine phosphatase RsbU (regulator of sigma subunit)
LKQPILQEENQHLPSQQLYEDTIHFVEVLCNLKSKSLEDWVSELLHHLIPYLKGQSAGFFRYNAKRNIYKYKGGYNFEFSEALAPMLQFSPEEIYFHSYIQKPQISQITQLPQEFLSPTFAQKEGQIANILLVPLYHEEAFLGVIEIFFEDFINSTQFAVLNRLQKSISVGFWNILSINALHKQVEDLTSLNNAMESSQQALMENAVKFMRVHKQLTDSIQYAKKMQEAILPSPQTLSAVFEEYFVIYQPKDIVSGDFYWFSQPQYTFIATIDCTGHGVPGAFMSMIGYTLLNEIVNSNRIYDPSQILSLLHWGVKDSLKQNESNNIDGMDVCLCRMERDENFDLHLVFAGAKRPLYYFHQDKLHKIKGSRAGIGGWQREEDIEFENHYLTLDEGDLIYLSTDGFSDISNPERHTFGENRFTQMLTNYCQLPMEEQKQAFLNTLQNYQQNTPQRDDITLVGIKV